MKRKIVKTFNLEAAKNGAKIETRNGKEVEILRWNLKNLYPIIGIVTLDDEHESDECWTNNGMWLGDTYCRDNDLVIAEYEDIPEWKPTDEQIEAIRRARSFVVDDFGEHPTLSEILMELEGQLRKIKEDI